MELRTHSPDIILSQYDCVTLGDKITHILLYTPCVTYLFCIEGLLGKGSSNVTYKSTKCLVFHDNDNGGEKKRSCVITFEARCDEILHGPFALRVSLLEEDYSDALSESLRTFVLYEHSPHYTVKPHFIAVERGSKHICMVMDCVEKTLEGYLDMIQHLPESCLTDRVYRLLRLLSRCLDSYSALDFQHGDLKADNIVCTWNEDLTLTSIQLIDFGLCRFKFQGEIFETSAFNCIVKNYMPHTDIAFFLLHTYYYCKQDPMSNTLFGVLHKVISKLFHSPLSKSLRSIVKKPCRTIQEAVKKINPHKLYKVGVGRQCRDLKQFLRHDYKSLLYYDHYCNLKQDL